MFLKKMKRIRFRFQVCDRKSADLWISMVKSVMMC